MKIAIVIPRYGEQIVGGAETLARTLAEYTAQQKWQVTVLTTCAQNHHTWENSLPAGKSEQNGVTIHRFPIIEWDKEAHHQLNYQLGTQYAIPLNAQHQWLTTGPHSPALYAHIQQNEASYDAILALPYLSTIVQYAAWVVPEKTILIPCLHEEAHAFMDTLQLLLSSVKGILFLTPEEQQFALHTLKSTIRQHAILGVGLDDPPTPLPTIDLPDVPYIATVSRLEEGKNLALLYEYVQRYVDEEGGELQLLLMGTGTFPPPEHPAFKQLGFVAHEKKLAYVQSSLALCQPSLMESFSIVIMESWQMGRPVLVHKNCAVTAGHVKRSGAGFTFASYQEFADAVDWLKMNPREANDMGAKGEKYVIQNYRWPILFAKLESFLG